MRLDSGSNNFSACLTSSTLSCTRISFFILTYAEMGMNWESENDDEERFQQEQSPSPDGARRRREFFGPSSNYRAKMREVKDFHMIHVRASHCCDLLPLLLLCRIGNSCDHVELFCACFVMNHLAWGSGKKVSCGIMKSEILSAIFSRLKCLMRTFPWFSHYC